MKNTDQSLEEDSANPSSSSLNRLPDEIILQILTKLPDLKTLCYCHLVSRRFSSIVLQIHTVSFIVPLLNPPDSDLLPENLFQSFLNGVVLKPVHFLRRIVSPYNNKPIIPRIISSFYNDSFQSAVSFLSKFTGIKSLSIELPSSTHTHRGIYINNNNYNCLFKWKVKLGNRIESFLFVSPDSICNLNENSNDNELDVECNVDEAEGIMEPNVDSFKRKVHIAFQCLKDVIMRHRMLLYFIKDHPRLEKVSITDSQRTGTLSLNGEKLAEVRGLVNLDADNANRIEVPVIVSQCYVPVLKLPVSGYVMKGITLVVMQMSNAQNENENGNDWFVNGEDRFEDAVEAAYSEAVTEILENQKDKMKRLL